jgi:branched-chain amino acid transport system ATP-binding protein
VFFQVQGIHTFLGKGHIINGVSLEIGQGETIALLGRNGVGKSTTMKSIMGITPPQKGSIRLKGEEIAGLRPYRICRMGIGYVPEERRIFSNLSVRQNLMMGIKPGQDVSNPWTIEKVYDFFPQLRKRDRQKGGHLSGGEQQMLTVARTLMGNPELLLADEPTEGLSPLLVKDIIQILREANQQGHSLIIVAQAMDVALSLTHRVYVMSKGEIVFRGTGEELEADREVRSKYLEV